MRLLAVAILSIVTAVPAVAHRRKHIKIPLPQERIVNDDNIRCVNGTSGCGSGLHPMANDMDVSSGSLRAGLGHWPSSSELVPTEYVEEDISTLLKQNYDHITGWKDSEVSTVYEPVMSYTALSTAVHNASDISNRRVSFSLDTIIPIFLIPCQALFAIVLWFFIKPRYKRDDHYNWYDDRLQRRCTWRCKCVSSVGLITCLVRQLLRHGTRTSRRLTTSFRDRLSHWQRTTRELSIS